MLFCRCEEYLLIVSSETETRVLPYRCNLAPHHEWENAQLCLDLSLIWHQIHRFQCQCNRGVLGQRSNSFWSLHVGPCKWNIHIKLCVLFGDVRLKFTFKLFFQFVNSVNSMNQRSGYDQRVNSSLVHFFICHHGFREVMFNNWSIQRLWNLLYPSNSSSFFSTMALEYSLDCSGVVSVGVSLATSFFNCDLAETWSVNSH